RPSDSSTTLSSSSGGSLGRNESRTTSSGTSYSSPWTALPPSATSTRPGNSSRTEKKRYLAAVSTSPMNGCSAMVSWTAPPRIPSPLVISSTMPGSVGLPSRQRVDLPLQHLALTLARAQGDRGLQLAPGLVGAAEPGEQLAADAGEQVRALQRPGLHQ